MSIVAVAQKMTYDSSFVLKEYCGPCKPVLVSRVDPDSRKNTINEIIRRATSGGEWPQVKYNRCLFKYIENLFFVHLYIFVGSIYQGIPYAGCL